MKKLKTETYTETRIVLEKILCDECGKTLHHEINFPGKGITKEYFEVDTGEHEFEGHRSVKKDPLHFCPDCSLVYLAKVIKDQNRSSVYLSITKKYGFFPKEKK